MNKFKISAPTWNDELPNGLFFISDIQDYFEYIFKKHINNNYQKNSRVLHTFAPNLLVNY